MSNHSSSPDNLPPEEGSPLADPQAEENATGKLAKLDESSAKRDPNETIDPYETIIMDPGFDPHATITDK